MLFNSYEFLVIFLPLVLFVYWQLSTNHRRAAIGWITLASFLFYGWQTPYFLTLLVGSLIANYTISTAMSRVACGGWLRRTLLLLGVVVNLGVIGYFKYSFFVVENVNFLVGTAFKWHQLILPTGISFYTFQQIAYLVDRYRDEIENYSFLDYCLFVTFFPQLIAGPIVHPKEMLPQFMSGETHPKASHFAVGLTIFFIGLFKKTFIADGLITLSGPVFDAAQQGHGSNLIDSWLAALAYTLQLYFDFSGYSDMAIGLGRMFGIRLPMNFNSPYKAVNIIEFWRCWHITLSRFLRDYIYFPLGGSRLGPSRRYLNLMATMLLGGLWHGAGWTYILWGALHGLFLIVNHSWIATKKRFGMDSLAPRWQHVALARSVTFAAVVAGWVVFRAPNLQSAGTMFQSMLGMNGVALPLKWLTGPENLLGVMTLLQTSGVMFSDLRVVHGRDEVIHLAALLAIVWFAPNTQQIMSDWEPVYETLSIDAAKRRLIWQPTPKWAFVCSVVTVLAILQISRATEFLYFQF
jgi:alginate O-acetyltransferase complex protein AlgI